jgi:hypothetical protein
MTVLHDPVLPFDPSSQRELLEPEQEADARGERPEPLGDFGDRSGYARTETGTDVG